MNKLLKSFTIIYFIVIFFFSCDIKNNDVINKTYFISNEYFEDTLFIETTNTMITKMKLEVSGNIVGKAKLYYCYSSSEKRYYIELSDENVNKKIETDWYQNVCWIKYEPEDSFTKGKIEISITLY